MEKLWTDIAWEQYTNLLNEKKTIKKINELIKDIERNGEKNGIGKPEELKGELAGYYSRRIDEKNRIVYKIENKILYITQCYSHYGDK